MKTLLQIRASLFSDNGPSSQLADRGDLYAGTPKDTQTPSMRVFLGFLGIEDVRFTYAEGLDISPAVKVASPARAKVEIDRLELFEPAVA
jgi:FMN-dependent NADH-azoreductase